MNTQSAGMKEYLYVLVGLGIKRWVVGATAKTAGHSLWNSLTDDQRNAVVDMEYIDERPAQQVAA